MVTGPQNMPVFNDLNIYARRQARHHHVPASSCRRTSHPADSRLGSLGPVSEGLFIWIFGLGAIVAITVWLTAKSN